MAIDITISLVKYSHASPPPPGGQLPWEHLFPGDLFLLLRGEGERPHSGALTCQVVYGSKVVEHIDIAACVDRASNVSSRLRSLGVKVQREQLPIFGIVKDAVLAIRHQRDGLPERVQLRFESAAKCQEIKGILERRGMDFEERASRPAHSDASSSRPGTAILDNESPAKQQNLSPPKKLPIKSPFHMADMEAGSLSNPSATRAQYFGTQDASQTNGAPWARQDLPGSGRDHGSTSDMQQVRRSVTTQHNPSPVSYFNDRQLPAKRHWERPSSASQTTTVDAIRQAAEEYDLPTSPMHDSQRPRSPQQQLWPAVDTPRMAGSLSSDPTAPRPATAASATSTTGPEGPPFPYKRDDSQRSSGGSSSRPSSSALALPDLMRPRVLEKRPTSSLRENIPAPAMTEPTTRPVTAVPHLRYPAAADDIPAQTPYDAASSAQQGPHLTRPDNGVTRHQGPKTPAEQTMSMYERPNGINTPPQMQARNNAAVHRTASSTDAPHEIESPPRTSGPISNKWPGQVQPESDSRDDLATNRAYAAIESPERGLVRNSELLERYHSQSPPDRMTALEQFMIENLNNPLFTTLCEDLEGCWNRIQLGL